jgi:hypothetical protein
MRPRSGGGRVVTRGRQSLGGQVTGTGIRHELHLRLRGKPPSAVDNIVRRVVPTTFPTPLMARIRLARRVALAAVAAVDVSTIVRLAAVEERRAARAANSHQYFDNVHARTTAAAFMELAPPARGRASSPRSASTRDTKAQGANPGPSSFAVGKIPTRHREPSPILGRLLLAAAISPNLGDRQDTCKNTPIPGLHCLALMS